MGCRCNCSGEFSPEKIREIQHSFSSSTKESQDAWIAGCLEGQFPKVQKRGTRRNRSFVKYESFKVKCCKKYFLHVFDVLAKRVWVIQKKISAGVMNFSEQRGKHHNRYNKISEDTWKLAEEHLQLITHSKSH